MSRRHHLALLAPALLFFAPALFLGRVPYLRDTGVYFFPHKALIARALHEGRLPQWNPLEFGGLPFLADPNFNVFHPLSLLTDALPLPFGFSLFLFACALLGAYGTYLVARQLEIPPEGALLAALAFAWSGPFLAVLEGGQVVAAAFMPWVCAAALAGSLPLVAVAAALVFLSGTPEIGGCALLFGLLLSRQRLRFLLGVALGAGLAAVQLFPTAAFVRESSRAAGFGFREATDGALRLARLPELVVPSLEAPLASRNYLEAVHLGIVSLLLAARGFRKRPLLLAAAAVLFVLALGAGTPVYALAWKVFPPVRLVRFPEKFLVPMALVIALHAGSGLALVPRYRWLLTALLALELGVAAVPLDRTVPGDELLQPPALVQEIARDAAVPFNQFRVDVQSVGVTGDEVARLGDPGWPLARKLFRLRRDALYGAEGVLAGVSLGRGYSGFTPGGMRELYQQGPRSLDALAIRYGVDFGSPGKPSPYAALGFTPLGTREGGLIRLWRNPRALPRLRLASAVLPGRTAFPPCEAISLPEPELRHARGLLVPDCAHAQPAAGSARIVAEEPERVALETDSPAPAVAVLADTMSNGWTVTVDGVPSAALHADGALRGVAVPGGKHAVVWRYRAPGLLAGAAVSAVSLLLVAFLFLRDRRRHSPPTPRTQIEAASAAPLGDRR